MAPPISNSNPPAPQPQTASGTAEADVQADANSGDLPQGTEGPKRPVSVGVVVEGGGGLEAGPHKGGGAGAGVSVTVPLTTRDKDANGVRAEFQVDLMGRGGQGTKSVTPPGGNDPVTSQFKYGEFRTNLEFLIRPKIGEGHRFFVGPGVWLGIGGFKTPKDGEIPTPGQEACDNGDAGQAECEPEAGPTVAAGTKGLENPNSGGVRETSGFMISGGGRLIVGGTVYDGPKADVDVYGAVDAGGRALIPTDGNPLTKQAVVQGTVGVAVRFGAGAKNTEGVGSAQTTDTLELTVGEPTDVTEQAYKLAGGKKPDQVKFGLRGEEGAIVSGPPYVITADKPGDYVLTVIKNGRAETMDIVVPQNTPDVADVDPSTGVGASGPFVLSPAKGVTVDPNTGALQVKRPTPQPGVALPDTLPAGQVQVSPGTTAKIQPMIDGVPVGEPIEVVNDGKVRKTVNIPIPADTTDGHHDLSYLAEESNGKMTEFPMPGGVDVAPAMATLSGQGNVITPPKSYKNDPVRVSGVKTSDATKAEVTGTDSKGRTATWEIEIPAEIPATGLEIVPPNTAKTLPLKGWTTFTLTPTNGSDKGETMNITGRANIRGTASGGPPPPPPPPGGSTLPGAGSAG